MKEFKVNLIFLIIIAMVAFLCLVIYGCTKDNQKWENFKMQHHCKVTAHIEGGMSPGIGLSSSGKPVATTNFESDKTGYLCDDGITYYKED